MTYSGALGQNNITAGYIDLASAWRLDADYLYVGTKLSSQFQADSGITHFMKSYQRSSWFTQMYVTLDQKNGNIDFGSTATVTINRLAEYMCDTWLRVALPRIELLNTNQHGGLGTLRWCKNIGHNLIEDCQLTVNDQVIARIDSSILDIIKEFYEPYGQTENYDALIGNGRNTTAPHPLFFDPVLKETVLNIPLSFFFARETALALPISSLVFVEIKIIIKFRHWRDLLILQPYNDPSNRTDIVVGTDIDVEPKLRDPKFWARFILTNEFERAELENVRDMIVPMWQSSLPTPYEPANPPIHQPNFTFSVRALYPQIINTSWKAERSCYTADSPQMTFDIIGPIMLDGQEEAIKSVSLSYESQGRLNNTPWDILRHVATYHCGIKMPAPGLGLIPYSVNIVDLQPNGSTNYSKLGQVQIQFNPTTAAIDGYNGAGTTPGYNFPQRYEMQVHSEFWTVIRIQSGQLVMPYI